MRTNGLLKQKSASRNRLEASTGFAPICALFMILSLKSLSVCLVRHFGTDMNEDDYLEDLHEDSDNGEEWDFTDEDGEEHNTGDYA